jgi:23S rRNA (guanosine2251-2'-O)-methyltransferase
MERGGGRKGGFGGSKGGAGASRGPRREGSSAPRPYKPRGESSGGERSYAPRAPRTDGDRPARPYTPRAEGDRPARPYVKREGGSYDRKPREGGSSYEKREYKPREAGDRPARAYAPRAEGDRPARPYVKREGGSYDRKPREGGSYEKREYKPREAGDRPARPYTPRGPRAEGDRPARPYVKREGGSYDRKPREGGSSYEKREYKPREPREGGFERAPREERGEGKVARFDGKRQVRRDYRNESTPAEAAVRGDGWLVGYHAVLAAMTSGRRKVRSVWLLGEPKGELATVLEKNPDWPVETKAKPDFDREFGDMVHQGVAVLVGNLQQPSLPELLGAKPKLLVALDQVTDPHNLGAIMRSCAAFGVEGVIVTEHRSASLNMTVGKVAAGAMEIVPVAEITNLAQSIEMMKEAGYTVVGLAGDTDMEIGELQVTGPLCLVVGSEGEGLRRLTREHCDKLVKIAIAPAMESLNVSVATGVALGLITRRK